MSTVTQLQAIIDAQAATLERVRAVASDPCIHEDEMRRYLLSFLAALGPAPAQLCPSSDVCGFGRSCKIHNPPTPVCVGDEDPAPAQSEPDVDPASKVEHWVSRAEAAEARCARLEKLIAALVDECTCD